MRHLKIQIFLILALLSNLAFANEQCAKSLVASKPSKLLEMVEQIDAPVYSMKQTMPFPEDLNSVDPHESYIFLIPEDILLKENLKIPLIQSIYLESEDSKFEKFYVSKATNFNNLNNKKTEYELSVTLNPDINNLENGDGKNVKIDLNQAPQIRIISLAEFKSLKTNGHKFENLEVILSGNSRPEQKQLYYEVLIHGEFLGTKELLASIYAKVELDNDANTLDYFRIDVGNNFRSKNLSFVLFSVITEILEKRASAADLVHPKVSFKHMRNYSFSSEYGGSNSGKLDLLSDKDFYNQYALNPNLPLVIKAELIEDNLLYLAYNYLFQKKLNNIPYQVNSNYQAIYDILSESSTFAEFIEKVKQRNLYYMFTRLAETDLISNIDKMKTKYFENKLSDSEKLEFEKLLLAAYADTPSGKIRKKMGYTDFSIQVVNFLKIRLYFVSKRAK